MSFWQKHKLLRLLVVLIVCVTISLFSLVKPVVIAHAAATISIGSIIAIVASFLLSIGVTFSSTAERDRVAMSFYNNAAPEFKSWVDNTIQFPGAPQPGGGDDKDPKNSGWLGQLLSVPNLAMGAGLASAAAMFTAKKGEVGKVEDVSGLGIPLWHNNIGKPLSAIPPYNPGFHVDSDSGVSIHFPIPIIINSIPNGSPDVNYTSVPIAPSVLLPYLSNYELAYSGSSVHFGQNTSTQVTRITGPSGTTYDFRSHVVLTTNGLLVSLSCNGEFLASRLISYDGSAQIRNVTISFGFDQFFNPCLSFAFEYLKGETWRRAGHPFGSNYSPSFVFYGDLLSGDCVFTGFVNGQTGVVNPIEVSYIPSTISSALSVGIIQQAMADAALSNKPLEIQVPSTDEALTTAPWQDLVHSQEAYIQALERYIERLEAGGTITPPEPPPPPEGGGDQGSVELPNLKLPADLTKVFPFSIPFDVARAFEVFTAEPVAPRFEIPFKVGDIVDEKIVLDFDEFAFIIEIVRWGELIIFTVGLAAVTRNYIKW